MTAQTKASAGVKRRVLVTGAAGCVGCQLVDELHQASFHVVAVDRPGAPLQDALPGSLDVHQINLTDAQAARKIARGVDVVVNLAAIADVTMPFEKLAPVNLDAVRVLF